MSVYDTTSVVGGFGQVIQFSWALGDDRQFSGDVQLSPNPPPPTDLSLTDAWFTLKAIPTQPDQDALIQKHITTSLTAAGQITAGLGGALSQLLIKIASGDYEGINSISAGPAYNWDIRCITSAGVTFTVAQGIVIFYQNDTQANQAGVPASFPNNGQPRFRGFIFDNPQEIMGLTGTFNAGDFYFNSNPINGNGTGWQCAIAGSPGTWLPFGGGGSASFNIVFVLNSASPYSTITGQAVFASAGTSTPTVIVLPAAVGSGLSVIIKKIDSNAQPVTIAPAGTDTIDGVNAIKNITIQNFSLTLLDAAIGQWEIV